MINASCMQIFVSLNILSLAAGTVTEGLFLQALVDMRGWMEEVTFLSSP